MKQITNAFIPVIILLLNACSTTKDLLYLNNLEITSSQEYFPYDLKDYQLQYRDVLYIDIKTQLPDGRLENVLLGSTNLSTNVLQSEASYYLIGYSVDDEGNISLPLIGKISVAGKSLKQVKQIIQTGIDSVLNHSYVDVKLLSFKFTVLGEVRNPGAFINYNDYLTVIEAIGRAGGITDYGRRDNVLVVRPSSNGTATYKLNLQDKSILSSPAYFIRPNDVIILSPVKNKVFNLNLPSFTFIVTALTSTVTTTVLLINYFKK